MEKSLAIKSDPVITKVVLFGGNSSASSDALVLNSTIDNEISTIRYNDSF